MKGFAKNENIEIKKIISILIKRIFVLKFVFLEVNFKDLLFYNMC